MSSLLSFRKLLPLTALVVLACGGNEGTDPPPPTPAIAMALSATSGSVQAGNNATVTATVTRTNFTGAVTVAVTGAPTGVTPTVASTGDSHTITIATAATTTPGSYNLTVTASGTGVTSATSTFALTVTPRPSIALALSPTSASVQQGGNTTFTATVTPTAFTGATSVAVTGAPTGVTTTVTTNANVHTVAVAVAASTAPGTYQLTATASGTGVTSVTANFALTVTAASSGSVTIAANPNTLNATAGGASVTSNVTITRTSFTGAVALAASGLPTGATAAFNPTPTSGNTSTLTLTFAANTAAGTYPITITASGTGIANASTQVSVTVAAAPVSSVALTATPATLSIAQGASGTATINIARTNFASALNLAVTGAPNGVNATLSSASTTDNSVTLNVAVGAAVAPGNYTLTITGSAAGVANATTTVALTVTQVSQGGNVTLSFCGAASQIPIWLASQNGAGAWTQVTAGANNTFSFNITSTGGVAWVTQNGTNDFDLTIYYGTSAELSGLTTGCLTPTVTTLTGTVAGLGATDQSSINFGGASASPTAASANFTLNNAPTGARDLLGARMTIDIMNPLAGFSVNRLFLKRAVTPNAGSVGTVDFNSATDAFAPEFKNINIAGGTAGEQYYGVAVFTTGTQTSTVLGFALPGNSATVSYAGVPSARTQAGDLHLVTATAAVTQNFVPVSARTVTQIFRVAADVTATLGPAMSAVTVTNAGNAGTHARLRAQFARQAEYANLWNLSYSQGTQALQRSAIILLYPSYTGAGANIDYTVPDFSGVGGWNNLWGIQTGTSTNWTAMANGWVVGAGNQAEGMVSRTTYRTGTITP